MAKKNIPFVQTFVRMVHFPSSLRCFFFLYVSGSFPRCTVCLKKENVCVCGWGEGGGGGSLSNRSCVFRTATHIRNHPSLVSHDEYGHDPRVVLVVKMFRYFLLPVHRHVVNRFCHLHHLIFPSFRRQDGRRRADIWQFLYHGLVEVIPKID